MNRNKIFIESLSLAGYRSFGENIQRFESFSKINLFIGQNNCGKSNILKFIHDVYPELSKKGRIKFSSLDQHRSSSSSVKFVAGISISLQNFKATESEYISNEIEPRLKENERALDYVLKVFKTKSQINKTKNVWFDFNTELQCIDTDWKPAFESLANDEIQFLWHILTNATGGDRNHNWFPESLKKLAPTFKPIQVVLIPAIRKIGVKESASEDFSGEGIVERLAKLQNPNVLSQEDRNKFNNINDFLQYVTGNSTACIEIPHERDTILVHMDNRVLPLESLGTGIHEVIILASAATVLEDTVICLEEPELHLNPVLQKKLIKYLLDSTNNQYFISTHSAAFMDTPEAEIYHISLNQGESTVRRVPSDRLKSEVCEDLGYHPSDLLQSNCIIWVEGPSDRIYINYWIHTASPELVEGIHYSIMFYGGKLASHLSGNDIDQEINEFISLRRLNRRSVIVIDSDKQSARVKINSTKKRLEQEFNNGPGFAWITKGREIENYLPELCLKTAIKKVMPSAKLNSEFGDYDNRLSITTKMGKKSQASKVDIAKYITKETEVNFSILDLKKQIKKLVLFIKESNPSLYSVK